jgi:hypothetical protein
MPASVGSGSTWKSLIGGAAGVSGAWKSLLGIWVGASGVWKFVWAAVNAPATNAYDTVIQPNDAFTRIRWNADGTWDKAGSTGTAPFTWLPSGSASDYEIQFTLTTGDTPDGAALNTWHNLGTARSLSYTVTFDGFSELSGNGTYTIRHAASSTVVGTNSWNMIATVEV